MISKLLVANRGEIARRIFRTCREMGIATVAVFSEPDRMSPFVHESDEAVALGGEMPIESYLRIDALLDAAKKTGADAIHPGYGFLAENPALARAVIDAGLIWVGPSPEAMEVMGSKLESKRIITAAGVPTLASRDTSGLTDAELAAAGNEIGYPLLVKASAGGGGKGMRIVDDPLELVAAVAGAIREATASFGDGTVFLERYLERSRHIEIQVFGDAHGNLVSLFERDCSIQRRHQKIVEEAPSPSIDPRVRELMGKAAVEVAKSVDYQGAGTVEFLFQEGDFYFLEMNTRLQVEHPVTEMITGLDLVRLQIEVAEGRPLPPEALEPHMDGHAIEVRLYAEDVCNGFLPVTGTLDRFEIFESPHLRVDSGVESGSEVSVFYDPMLAKVVAWAPTRAEAARLLSGALRRSRIHGSVTNRDLLVRILRHREFLDGSADTHFLSRHDPVELGGPLPNPAAERMSALAAALTAHVERTTTGAVLQGIPGGWRNNPSQLHTVAFRGTHHPTLEVGYRFERNGNLLTSLGTAVMVTDLDFNSVGLEVDGVLGRYTVSRVGDSHHVDGPHGYSRLVELSRFPSASTPEEPGSLHAPMPGRVVAVAVEAGQEVEEGEALVVMEAMKMEHTLRSPRDGTVADVRVSIGEQVLANQVLVVVEI